MASKLKSRWQWGKYFKLPETVNVKLSKQQWRRASMRIHEYEKAFPVWLWTPNAGGAHFSWLGSDCLSTRGSSARFKRLSSIGGADICWMLELNVLTSKWWLRKHWDAQWQPISKCAKFFVKSFEDIYFWTWFRQRHLKSTLIPLPSPKNSSKCNKVPNFFVKNLKCWEHLRNPVTQ